MKDHDIDDQLFWDLSKKEMVELLDIQVYGRLEKLTKQVNKHKKEHNKAFKKEHPDIEIEFKVDTAEKVDMPIRRRAGKKKKGKKGKGKGRRAGGGG